MTRFLHFLSALPIYIMYSLFKCLPLDVASWLGGCFGKGFGPFLPVHKRALYNIKRIIPKESEEFYQQTLLSMWENLGRNLAELPHLRKIIQNPKRLKLKNLHHTKDIKKNVPGFVFSAHYGNWELCAPAIAQEKNVILSLVYRKINNPYIEKLIKSLRLKSFKHVRYFPKGSTGAKACIRALKQKETIGMLLDQKLNDGISIPFMGEKAMTAPSFSQLSLKFQGSIVPVRCIRHKGAYFTLEFFPPISLSKREKLLTIEELTREINDIIGQWVFEYPEQWFWVHSRWPFSKNMS